jgi:hypothetical protein
VHLWHFFLIYHPNKHPWETQRGMSWGDKIWIKIIYRVTNFDSELCAIVSLLAFLCLPGSSSSPMCRSNGLEAWKNLWCSHWGQNAFVNKIVGLFYALSTLFQYTGVWRNKKSHANGSSSNVLQILMSSTSNPSPWKISFLTVFKWPEAWSFCPPERSVYLYSFSFCGGREVWGRVSLYSAADLEAS